ncbi:hypothetical protein WR25_07170 [Diploscapter pachys]|uniref:Uncharacterized protein n=1 Tax=Diploscapter pachys TaxID=2018661 RepID=A0A2A2KUF2_9BILA|nr:hypothetical protein WR25_07170 [Diploscapter pachys]
MTDKYYLKYDEKNGYPKSFPILNGIIKKEKEVIYSSLDKIRKGSNKSAKITYSSNVFTGPHITTIGVTHSDDEQLSGSPPDPVPSVPTIPLIPPLSTRLGNSPQANLSQIRLFVETSTENSASQPFGQRNGSLRSPIRREKADVRKLHSLSEQQEDEMVIDREQIRKMSKVPNGTLTESWTNGGETQSSKIQELDKWPVSKLAGQVAHSHTNSIRNYWQHNVAKEQQIREIEKQQNSRRKGFGFPKWRSTDALSASLVASNPVEIPADSRIPEQRLRKMQETEREAEYVKKIIHDSVEPTRPLHTLHKGKSLESLVIQAEKQPWYDKDKIKEAVSRESIANIHQSIMKFENGSFHQNGRDRSPTNSNSNSYSVDLIPPPLPPKSQIVQMRQQANVKTSQLKFDAIPPQVQNGYQPSYQSNRVTNGYHDHSDTNGSMVQPSPRDPFEVEEELFLLYMRQNPDVVTSVGLTIPETTRQMMEELHWRRVELREAEDNHQNHQSNGFHHKDQVNFGLQKENQLFKLKFEDVYDLASNSMIKISFKLII